MDKYINSNGIRICYQSFGDSSNETIILIAGLGEQLGEWPRSFCENLADENYRVIRFDNRDIGLSDKMPDRRYSLNDMADDTAGLISALNINKAHIVGMSMGGMIAQILAAEYPDRVASLCSLMSSSGASGLPSPTPEVQEIITKKSDGTLDGFIENWVEAKRRIDSPAYPSSDLELYQRAKKNCARSYNPAGYMRHLNAIYSHGSRVELLKKIRCPTLVLHGSDDPLVAKECGEDTAKHIQGSTFKLIKGMGHNLPTQLHSPLSDSILNNIKRTNQ